MDPFRLHSVPGSPFGRAVLITLEEKAAPYSLAALQPGQGRTPEHLARHPFGRIPVLDHGDFRLYETQAILRYLDRILPSPPLSPSEPTAAARMDQLMGVNDWYLFQGVCNVIPFQRIVRPRFTGLAPDEDAIAAAMPRAHTVIDELARLLADQPYFVGVEPTLADILLLPQLDFLSATPEWTVLTAHNPRLPAWLARMSDRPSVRRTTWEKVMEMATA